jgi:AraC-like DNA-binding protein
VQFIRDFRLRQAREQLPDLIISDVMMPGLDGYALCQALKSDLRTSHIPIILLTARAQAADRLRGLSRGADAYLAKPFLEQELQLRARKLIELRRTLQTYYQQVLQGSAAPSDATEAQGEPEEEAFVRQVRSLLEAHYGDPDFNVNALAQAIAMSRSQLHRKLTSLAGLTPVQFIRDFRLRQARELLTTTDLTIAEVAYRTGFSDPGYFSRLFQQECGQSPSAYRAS